MVGAYAETMQMFVDQALHYGFIRCSFLSPFSVFYAVQES